MDNIQLIYPYYDNPGMFYEQQSVWAEWDRELKAKVKIIMVDDSSPNDAAEKYYCSVPGLDFELYRVHKNIPWNQNGAHNLAMHVADDGWCLMTDIDHVLSNENLARLLAIEPDEGMYYTLGRRQFGHLRVPYKRHPNSWLLTREMFLTSGGYDEDFSGYYGSDSVFKVALSHVGTHIKLELPYLIVYNEDDIPDANTREFERKHSKYWSLNHPHLLAKRRHWRIAINPIRFPWERIL